MKAKDIRNGAVVYYCTATKWAEGRDPGYKAVVVDSTVQAWENNPISATWTKSARASRLLGNYGVLIDVHTPRYSEDGTPLADSIVRRVAQPMQLRGSYDECEATVKANQRARQEKWDAANRIRQQQLLVADAATAACAQVGVRASTYDRMGSVYSLLPADVLTAMADELARHGWKYEGPR